MLLSGQTSNDASSTSLQPHLSFLSSHLPMWIIFLSEPLASPFPAVTSESAGLTITHTLPGGVINCEALFFHTWNYSEFWCLASSSTRCGSNHISTLYYSTSRTSDMSSSLFLLFADLWSPTFEKTMFDLMTYKTDFGVSDEMQPWSNRMPSIISISSSMVSSSFTVITHFSDLFHSLGNEVAVSGDCDDLHDSGDGGDGFGVAREEFEDTVDGSLGTSAKIHGLQLAATCFTASDWMAWAAMTVAVVVPSPPTSFVSS